MTLFVMFSVLILTTYLGVAESLIPLEVAVKDQWSIYLENNSANIPIIIKNPSNETVIVTLQGYFNSLPPNERNQEITARFSIDPQNEYVHDFETMKLWQGSWQLILFAYGNQTQQTENGFPVVVSTAYGQTEYTFKVYSLTEVVGIGSLIVGIVGAIPVVFALKKKNSKSEYERHDDTQQTLELRRRHTETLNNEVYRKLIRVEALPDHTDRLVLKIPDDPMAFNHRKSSNYFMWLNECVMERATYDHSIEYGIPYLKIGIEHLQDGHYQAIYELWQKVQKDIVQSNSLKKQIHERILNKAIIILKESFPSFSHHCGNINTNTYDIEKIADILVRFSVIAHYAKSIPKFELKLDQSWTNSWFRVTSMGRILMQGNNKEELDMNKFEQNLLSIYNDLHLDKDISELVRINGQISEDLRMFRERLEDDVVVGIDSAGHLIKGKCSACQ